MLKPLLEDMHLNIVMLTETSERLYAHIKRLEGRIKKLEDSIDIEHMGYAESEEVPLEEKYDSLG